MRTCTIRRRGTPRKYPMSRLGSRTIGLLSWYYVDYHHQREWYLYKRRRPAFRKLERVWRGLPGGCEAYVEELYNEDD